MTGHATTLGKAAGLTVEGRTHRGVFDLVVDLTIRAGQTVAVVGPNGAGKTSLLRLIAGLVALDSGRIEVGGMVWDDPEDGQWLSAEQRSVGFVFQDRLLFPHLSVRDNVAFGLVARKVERSQAHARALQWLKKVGLADRADAGVEELSGGQAQRVALARALILEPQVALLDEPLSGLDTDTRDEMTTLVHDVLAGHVGVGVVVTHDPREAALLADRIVVIEHGRMTQSGTLDELQPTGYLARFLG